MFFCFYFFKYLFYISLFINDVGCSQQAFVFSAVKFFRPPGTVFFDNLLTGVGNKRKRQIVFFNKFFV